MKYKAATQAIEQGKALNSETVNPCGLEPQLIKLEFIIYPPKLKVVVEFTI
jgi:hypothetical protein